MKYLLNLLIIILLFVSCKYENGPKISLWGKTHRVVSSWHLHKVYDNGKDMTDIYKGLFSDFEITFKKDKTYEITFNYSGLRDYRESGRWIFSENKNAIDLISDKGQSFNGSNPNHWKILRLKEKQLWFRNDLTSDGREDEIHLKN